MTSKSAIVSSLVGACLAMRVPLAKKWTKEPVTTIQKHMHSLRAGFDEDLSNFEDLSYTGTGFMGTPL